MSKTRKRKRRTHFKLEQPTLVTCPQCGEYKLPHHACTSCGTYKGRVVLSVK
ncbi:ribosomal protein L32 [Alicyclobacillus acidocaldarius subsp. acidocaldarius Tc-4-1]|uniref:Large ribosomal subunit protein bL32 n=1 Tax=Alicyclobacillus acidocaldarius (strain Tc-4-1) TaxID=1048834 RepID=F8IHC3_ALIAT|nr:ribosomal protein L32 [Alicyclobacillus acidocaldarius subsp. acidocaldarius Tc-4-1]